MTFMNTWFLRTTKEQREFPPLHRPSLHMCGHINAWQLLRRRLKCDGEEGSITCNELPAIENFVAVARSLQRSRGIPDSEFRVFVGADMVESYTKVLPAISIPHASYFI